MKSFETLHTPGPVVNRHLEAIRFARSTSGSWSNIIVNLVKYATIYNLIRNFNGVKYGL